MKVSVMSSIDNFSFHGRNSVQSPLLSLLACFTPKIIQVSVLGTDENGPRGGVDKLGRINVVMPGIGTVITTARRENLVAAVSAAARRARRIVVGELIRASSVFRGYRAQSFCGPIHRSNRTNA
ncbi:MAG TPA: hypothetical protein DDZ51_19705 [Planctomycetaceae bacterium]|nr:hypothetical protein [Planctomycetaceae bacterium]